MSDKTNCPCSAMCPLQSALNIIGGKWKIPLLCSLMVDGPLRYNELLKRTKGISNTMLSQTLKELEEDGLIIRKEYIEVPIRVEYSTTDRSQKLLPILEQLVEWYVTEK